MSVIIFLLLIPLAVLMVILAFAQIIAGMGMLRMEMRRWSLFVSWVSLLPIGPVFPIAILISIWSLVTLRDRQVLAAYQYKAKMGGLPVAKPSELPAKAFK